MKRKSANNRNFLSAGCLIIPIACAALASMGYGYAFHVAVPVSCAVLIMLLPRKQTRSTAWLLVAALLFSIAGDWMLKHRNGESMRFVYGIALFFIAHGGYLAFCLKNGKIQRSLLLVSVAGYGVFFVLKLMPAIASLPLTVAVLMYTLILCFSLAAAPGLRLPWFARALFFAGIACIVFSDTLIACCEFLHECGLYFSLMMPTYYAAHILITAAVIKNR